MKITGNNACDYYLSDFYYLSNFSDSTEGLR